MLSLLVTTLGFALIAFGFGFRKISSGNGQPWRDFDEGICWILAGVAAFLIAIGIFVAHAFDLLGVFQ